MGKIGAPAHNRMDLNGKRFNRLRVLRLAEIRYRRTKKQRVVWTCICDCGKKCKVYSSDLRGGHTQSCGCLKRTTQLKHGHTHHGRPPSSIYSAWANMKGRCSNPRIPLFKYYGARGIKVCRRWQRFENFLADMGKKPSAVHTLERINNARGYSRSNCRWATMAEQAQNKRPYKRQFVGTV